MHAMNIDDAYRVVRTLSDGPTGTTELVTFEDSGPFVRKKIPRDTVRRSVWALLADCDCPYLPHICATYELPDQFVVVYCYIAGVTLKQRISSQGALVPDEAVHLLENVCTATGILHEHGVIHRDISPSNVIISTDGAHLIDLGIAQTYLFRNEREDAHLGTWGFAAPEQYGFAQTDVRSDVYSIGRLLGYMLTGVLPNDDTYEQMLQNSTKISTSLSEVIVRACSFEPSARFQTIDELVQAIRKALQQEKTHNREETVPVGTLADMETQTLDTSESGSPHKYHSHRLITLAASIVGTVALVTIFIMVDGSSLNHPEKDALPGSISPGTATATLKDTQNPGPSTSQDNQNSKAVADSEADNDLDASTGTENGDKTVDADSFLTENGAFLETNTNESALDKDVLSKDISDSILQTTDSWWSYQSGTVSYVYNLTNTSSDITVKLPGMRVTGKAADGSVVFITTDIISVLFPGDTTYVSLMAPCNSNPETVEFTPVEPNEFSLEKNNSECSFSFSNLSDINGRGETSFTGELTAESLPDRYSPATAFITIVLRDGNGVIVGGTTATASTIREGETVAFQASMFNAPDYASFEAYAWI